MNSPQLVWERIKNVFLGFTDHWIIVFEGVFLFVVIYSVIKTLFNNNAKRFIPFYMLLVLLAGVISLFAEHLTLTVFYLFFLLISLFFLMLFSIDIKRGIWNTNKRAGKTANDVSTKKSPSTVKADACISNIVRAVQNLSKNNIGALIVFSSGNLPKDIVDSGIALGADISSQLIEGIFIPKAPLHDGAMIIVGDKIQAAGCFLPLTQKDFPKDYGTRHRAGIGITEVADVSTVIVSEETGIVSVVKRGEITRYMDSESLKRFLKEYYWKDVTEGKKG